MAINGDTSNGNLTVGRLARATGLSRSTLLYYDRIGLLQPTGRSGANYRLYTPADRDRLEQVCFYRRVGIPLADIARLLDRSKAAGLSGAILQKRLQGLESQIACLQEQEAQIIRLMNQLSGRGRHKPGKSASSKRGRSISQEENAMVNKQRWVEIMKAAGFGEQEMRNWHKTFERMEPQAHQEFLESLGIAQDEIARIREWSGK